MIYREVIKEKL